MGLLSASHLSPVEVQSFLQKGIHAAAELPHVGGEVRLVGVGPVRRDVGPGEQVQVAEGEGGHVLGDFEGVRRKRLQGVALEHFRELLLISFAHFHCNVLFLGLAEDAACKSPNPSIGHEALQRVWPNEVLSGCAEPLAKLTRPSPCVGDEENGSCDLLRFPAPKAAVEFIQIPAAGPK